MTIEDAKQFRDFSHYGFELQKKAKRERKLRHASEHPTKEIHLRIGIADADLDRAVNQARRFLQNPANVRVSVDLVDSSQRERGTRLLERFIESVGEAASGVVPPSDQARQVVAVLWS